MPEKHIFRTQKYRKPLTYWISGIISVKLLTGLGPVTSSLPMRCATYCATAACSVITDLFNIQYFPHTVNTFPICLFPQKNAFVRILTQLIFFYLLFKNLLTFSTFIFILRPVITYGELIC